MGSHMSDEELWLLFLDLSPYVIGWGSGLVYEFNPDRARHQGLGVSVIAAVNQIRKPTRTSGPMYRRELWW
jgi:hypothetical protein